jgi:thioredoxin-dependent peroxiredoxin
VVRLRDFRGKRNVAMYFYPSDFSRGCELEAKTFAEKYDSFTLLNTEVLGVSSDPVDSHRRFSTEFNLPFPILSDEDNRLRRSYGVSATFGLIPGRVIYVIDVRGRIRHMFSSQCSRKRIGGRTVRPSSAD